MLVVSLFSVCAGGSLGPEAPLLTLCASLVGFIYKEVVVTEKKMLRQFSLMGMGAGLAAFFGASMGGMPRHRAACDISNDFAIASKSHAMHVSTLAVHYASPQRHFEGS